MAGYGMTGSSAGFGFGGGGFGGIGDFGQSLYTGLGNAMPMLTQLYNFQDANALRQDAMNAQSSSLRNQTFANGAEALKNALTQQMWQASIAKQVNPEDYDAMVRGIGKPPVQAAAPITTVESAAGTTGTVSGYVPQTIGGGIGQSRLTMLLLQLDHIGQVQCGVWPAQVRESVSALL